MRVVDECELTELRDPVASSLSLLAVINERPCVGICCISIDKDGCVSVLIDVLTVCDLLATAAD
jgi:hypothetical protein